MSTEAKSISGRPRLVAPIPHSTLLPPEVRYFPYWSFRDEQSKAARFLYKHPHTLLQAYTGFGKSELALTTVWPRFCENDIQLWLFAKNKAQLQSVFLRLLTEKFLFPPSAEKVVLPLIARRDLCLLPARFSCTKCPARLKARYYPTTDLRPLLQTSCTLQTCPSTLLGFREVFRSYGCPSELIRRSIPFSNIILLPHGYLETRYLREILLNLLTKVTKQGFNYSHREAILDEAHNFGPCIEATLSLEQLKRTWEVAPLSSTYSLLRLFDQPVGQVFRPESASSSCLSEFDAFLAQSRIRKQLTSEDYEALHAVRTFISRKGDFWVREESHLLQLDPYPDVMFSFLNEQFHRVILLSGTFWGIDFYKRFFGLESPIHYQTCVINPPIYQKPKLYLMAYLNRKFSSEPKNRTPSFFSQVAEFIRDTVPLVHDHTLLFCPSYDFLEALYEQLHLQLEGYFSIYREPPTGRISFRQALIEGPPSIILGVYGGKLSEGVEILDPTTGLSRLRFLGLIGLPFPPPSAKLRFTRKLYLKRYHYLPFTRWALIDRLVYNRLRQALGRAIRSETDRAVAIAFDYRLWRFRSIIPCRWFDKLSHLRIAILCKFYKINQARGINI